MTSETVYVFAAMDDGSQPIVGALRRAANDGRPLGVFAYARSWLESRSGAAFALDPQRMPLLRDEFTTAKRAGVHGPIADALPDRWGRRVFEAQNPGLGASETDLLLLLGADAVGRLRFSATTAAPDIADSAIVPHQIDDLACAFARIEQGQPAAPELSALYAAGRSLGGARPKTSVAHEGALWVAKLERRDDEFDQCAAEHASMRLAALCGIDVAETRVMDTGSRRVLLVRRFDRDEMLPSAHYLSALSALDLEETSHAGGYPELAGYLRRHSARPTEDRRELFRRMIFNILAGNRDDHLKNHALLYAGGAWRLSPAFDIAPLPGMEPLQAISVGALGAVPSLPNALSRCAEFALSQDDAQAIIDRMVAIMRSWRDRFAEWGVPDDAMRRLQGAFSADLDKAAPR